MVFKKLLVLSLLVVSASTFASAATSTATCISLTKNHSKGSENSEVLTLQQFLFEGGYLKQKPSGLFTSLTSSAVKGFQLANGISPVGSVGPKTRVKVKEVSCRKIAIQNTSSTTTALVQQDSSEISKVVNLGIYENKEVVERLYGTNMTPYFGEKYPMVGEKFITEGVLFGQGLSSDQEIKSIDVLTTTPGGAKASATFVDEVKTNKEYIKNPQTVIGKSVYTITVEWTPNLIDFEKTDTLTVIILFKDNKIQKIPLHNFPLKYVNVIKEDLKNKVPKDGFITVTDPRGRWLVKITAKDSQKPMLGILQLDEIMDRFSNSMNYRILRENSSSSNILKVEAIDSPMLGDLSGVRDKYEEKLIANDKKEKEKIVTKSSQKSLAEKHNQSVISTTTQVLIDERNLQRERDVKVIASAVEEYYVGNGFKFPSSVTSVPKETCINSNYSCEGMIEPWLAPKYIPVMLVEPGTVKKNGSGYLVSVSGKSLIISAQYTEGDGVIKKVMEISQ